MGVELEHDRGADRLCGHGLCLGSTWQGMLARADQSERSITGIQQQIEALPTMARQLDNHAYRIDRAEERAAEASQTMRAVEHTLNQLSSDIRVTREILERIEANSRSPPAD